jgi:Fe-S cluster assembly protein SufD
MSPAVESLLALREKTDRDWSADFPETDLADRLTALGREALTLFKEQGVPTRQLETWKGTNFSRLESTPFARVGPGASSTNASATAIDDTGVEPDLLFLDGQLQTASATCANLPEGVRVLSLIEAASEAPEILHSLARLPDLKQEPLTALQTAFFEDAAILHLDARAEAGRPIRIRSVSTADAESEPSADFPRLLVVAGRESRATLVFESTTAGVAPGLTAFVAEYHLDTGAQIETIQIQSESAERIHFTSAHARLEADAHFDSHVFSLGSGLVRSELVVAMHGTGAGTRMRAFFLGRDEGHVDHFTTVDHVAAQCTSDQEYRGVLSDRSKGVFRGRVIVQPGAQKTDARQSNPNLLLSDRATIDTKPQLEIYADDIRASHGSTIGQLDPDALFFLRARGIDESLARLVLTRAFAHSIVDGVADDAVREAVSTRVEKTLSLLENRAASGEDPR